MRGAWEMMVRGGIMMIPLMLTSVLGLAVIIERALFLRKKRILNPDLVRRVQHIEKAEDIDQLLDEYREEHNAFLNVIRAGWKHRGSPRDEMKEALADSGRQEIHTLERGLVVLETGAGIAPLMGLLGTVLGMIKVFDVIQQQGLGQTQSLSGGISEALITTVAGLVIAIPMLVFYHYFNHRIENLILEIEKYCGELLDKHTIFRMPRKGAS